MFLKMLEKLMNEKDLNISQVSKLSGIPYMTLRNLWVRGYENVGLATIKKIAAFFDVSIDYLVFGEASGKTGLSPQEQELVNAYRDNPTMQEAVNRILGLDAVKSTSEQLKEDIADELRDSIESVKSSV